MNECNQPEAEQRLSRLQRISNIFSQHRSMEHYRKKEGAMERERDGGRGGGKTQKRKRDSNKQFVSASSMLSLSVELSFTFKSHQWYLQTNHGDHRTWRAGFQPIIIEQNPPDYGLKRLLGVNSAIVHPQSSGPYIHNSNLIFHNQS